MVGLRGLHGGVVQSGIRLTNEHRVHHHVVRRLAGKHKMTAKRMGSELAGYHAGRQGQATNAYHRWVLGIRKVALVGVLPGI